MTYVYVNQYMFEEHVSDQFPYSFDGKFRYMHEFYENKNKNGLFLSVKIPGPEVGRGIHLTVLYRKNNKVYKIFTKPKNGSGHFRSGYIRRSHLWKQNVDKLIHQANFVFDLKYRKMKKFIVNCKYNSYQYASKLFDKDLEKSLFFYDYIKNTRSKKDVLERVRRYYGKFDESDSKLKISEIRNKYSDINGDFFKIEKNMEI